MVAADLMGTLVDTNTVLVTEETFRAYLKLLGYSQEQIEIEIKKAKSGS